MITLIGEDSIDQSPRKSKSADTVEQGKEIAENHLALEVPAESFKMSGRNNRCPREKPCCHGTGQPVRERPASHL